MDNYDYDFIVIGAGTSGSTIASRLTECGTYKVLLLEAGVDDPWIWLKVPLGAGYVLLSERGIWRLNTEPEKSMLNRQMFWPRGRVLGGSSTINGMLWVKGEPAEYDNWNALGCKGWSYQEVLPFFKRIETYVQGDVALRGMKGPVNISICEPDILGHAFHSACVQAGIPATPDYNGKNYEGVGFLQTNTKRGMRHGGREAYLDPARKRKNLFICTGARAHRIQIENGKAIGVEYMKDGKLNYAHAKREIVVSAGTIHSPQILELSGIGDENRLRKLGIPNVLHLPGVGENCTDHLHTRLTFECTRPITLNDIMSNPVRTAWMGLQFLMTRKGHMAACTATVHALAKSDPSLVRPDVKIQMHNLSAEDPRHPNELLLDQFPGFGIGTFALRPKSRGSVHISSSHPEIQPTIIANYLMDSYDRKTSVAGLKLARRIAEQPAIKKLIVREVRPGLETVSDDDFLKHIAKLGATSYHPIGTCKMGADSMSVVDYELRVHGILGLRVADASVMPTMASSNTNAPSFMIGERCAEFLLRDAKLH